MRVGSTQLTSSTQRVGSSVAKVGLLQPLAGATLLATQVAELVSELPHSSCSNFLLITLTELRKVRGLATPINSSSAILYPKEGAKSSSVLAVANKARVSLRKKGK